MRRMNELGAHRALGSMALVGLLGLGAFLANCAEAGPAAADDELSADASAGVDAVVVDTTQVDEARDASLDAGADSAPCDASDDDCKEPEWLPVNTGHPSGLGLSSIWGSGPSDVWAVGAKGSVIHWDGTTWASTPIDTSYSLQSVYGTGPNDVWVTSTASLIYRSTGFSSGTATFEKQTAIAESAMFPATIGALLAVWATGPGDVWVSGRHRLSKGGQFEASWRTTPGDGGVAWAPVSAFGSAGAVYGIWGSGPNDVWMVGSKGTTNMSFSSHTNGLAATDGGMPAWTEVDTATFSVLNAVWGTGPNDVWAVGNSGAIRHYTGGATWEIVESPTSQNLRGVWAAATDDAWAVGENGTVLHYDGTEWTPSKVALPKADKRDLYAVWGSGPDDVWAVGDGIVMHYSGPKHGAQGGSK